MIIPEGRPVKPWGNEPPPVPVELTPRERRRQQRAVRSAFRSWGSFRPYYIRDGDVIEAEVDLKDHVWSGRASAERESDAAWYALQDCIKRWTADIAVEVRPFRRGKSPRPCG